MERRDRWGVVVVSCAILGLISAGVTATAVRFPNGGYDMQGMWTIAAAGFAAWVVTTAIVAALLGPFSSARPPQFQGQIRRLGAVGQMNCRFPSEATVSRRREVALSAETDIHDRTTSRAARRARPDPSAAGGSLRTVTRWTLPDHR
jgi:hypothetical protein